MSLKISIHLGSFAPDSMIEAIRAYCKETGQTIPITPGELATVVYQSLAESYAKTISQLEEIVGKKYRVIHIVGGGSNADYLNQLTADATGKTVYAGPSEATAIGNLMAQMIQGGELENLAQGRKCVKESFPLQNFSAKCKNT